MVVHSASALDSSVLRDAVPVCAGGVMGASGDDCRCGKGCCETAVCKKCSK